MRFDLTKRQQEILRLVADRQPITSEEIAQQLGVARATIRPDLTLLTMAGLLDARPRVGYFTTGQGPEQVFSSLIRRRLVKEAMSRPVVIRETTSAYDAIATLFLEDAGTLFVVNEASLMTGVLSRKDLLKAAIGSGNLNEIPVHVLMTRMPHIVVCSPDEPAYDAAVRLMNTEVDALPVVEVADAHPQAGGSSPSPAYHPIGRFSKTNVVRLYTELGAVRQKGANL
ncbi:MAG: helix-turn-helix transcriptional regulator [Firmicutes bacterium]|nr:helix-turn-helix transcriptional regulator [Bacillota bacterium]